MAVPKTLSIIFLSLLSISSIAGTMCPDGSFVGGDSCQMTPDGKFVSGGGGVRMAPDGSYVSGGDSSLGNPNAKDGNMQRGVQMAPNGQFEGGNGPVTMCPDGSYVSGRCHMMPNGRFVGE
jgi:hypothetical protein